MGPRDSFQVAVEVTIPRNKWVILLLGSLVIRGIYRKILRNHVFLEFHVDHMSLSPKAHAIGDVPRHITFAHSLGNLPGDDNFRGREAPFGWATGTAGRRQQCPEHRSPILAKIAAPHPDLEDLPLTLPDTNQMPVAEGKLFLTASC